MRHCSRCDRWLQLDSFCANKRGREGRASYCRQCAHKLKVQYYANNRDRLRAYNRRYRAERGDIARQSDKAWAARNPSKILAKTARLRGAAITGEVDALALIAKFDRRCGICQLPLGDEVHFDHVIPISRGGHHGPDNVQPAHPTCNRRKFNKSLDEARAVLCR